MKTSLENRFAFVWRALNGPKLETEFRFHPDRRWRFDFAHPQTRTAIEIEGGVWNGGRHTRGKGYISDCEKYNTATLAGWRVFRLPGDLITAKQVEPIVALLKNI